MKSTIKFIALFTATAPAIASAMIPIEKVKDRIFSDKSRVIPGLKKAVDAFHSKKYVQTLKDIKVLEQNLEYKDFYHLISGQSEFALMRTNRKSGKSASAIANGLRAETHFKNLPGANAYTPFEKRSQVLLGLTEVELAELTAKTGNKKKARLYYESGFQRLHERNMVVLIPRTALTSYASICDRTPDDMCSSWELKLSASVPKPERLKVFPRLSKIELPPPVERQTSIPYTAAPDMQLWQDAFALYLEGKFEDAFNKWYDLLQKYPRTNIKLRTKFWMGRASQRDGKDARAETLYREVIKEVPFSYYSLMSSWYGGIDISRAIDAELPMALPEVQLEQPSDVFHLKRAETLIASGAPDLAVFELREIKFREKMPNEFLVYLAMLNYLSENHMTAFQVFSELNNRGYTGFSSSYGERMVFPFPYLQQAEQSAKSHKLDPLILLSVMKQESAFNPEAISTSNAFGLMQIIPPTAKDLDPNVDVIELTDPQRSAYLGGKYIRQLLNKYGGSIIWTLAAYNAGPGNADRWKKEVDSKNANLTPEEAIEFIGFRETHDYVQNILRNYYWYTKRTKGESFVHLPALLQNFQAQN